MKNTFILFLFLPLLTIGQMNYQNTIDETYNETGIYVNDEQNKLFPSVIGGTEMKKITAFLLTFGAVPQQRIPFLLSARSTQIVKHQHFEFILEDFEKQPLNQPFFERSFRNAKSPKEFLLIKLVPNTKKDRRDIFVQKVTMQTKVNANIIPFRFEGKSNGIFIVEPVQTLEKGEYCFVHQDILSAPYFDEFMFFDFTVE